MKRVLIADDDRALRGLLRLVAQRAGFEVDTAANGVEAVDKLRTSTYTVAVIDLMMPRLNGYEVLERLAEMQARPVVIVATAMNDAYLPRLDGRVVTSILRKPFDIDILVAMLHEVAGRAEQRRAETSPAAVELPAAPRLIAT